MMKMTGRTILVTGGSSGIGLEFARQLLARGNTVVVTGRRETALAEAHETSQRSDRPQRRGRSRCDSRTARLTCGGIL